jgi:hypothetical protein
LQPKVAYGFPQVLERRTLERCLMHGPKSKLLRRSVRVPRLEAKKQAILTNDWPVIYMGADESHSISTILLVTSQSLCSSSDGFS